MSTMRRNEAGPSQREELLTACLALIHAGFLRPRERLSLLEIFEDPLRIFSLSKARLEMALGRRLRTSQWKPPDLLLAAERDRKTLTQGSIRATLLFEDRFPPLLREIYDPPILLFYRGILPDHTEPLVAVVGTRRPTGKARSSAFRLGRELARGGAGVVSGLARGIDVEAHRGCLDGGGKAIAVLGNGLGSIYPKTSVCTARRILEQGGVLLSEYPPDAPPLKHNFPARNRIISGLSRMVVVIQAPRRSGALITAEYALDQGRDLVVHETGTVGAAGQGTAALAESGARVIRSARQVFSEWERPFGGEQAPRSPLYPDEGPSGTPAGRKMAALLEDELSGVKKLHNGAYFGEDG